MYTCRTLNQICDIYMNMSVFKPTPSWFDQNQRFTWKVWASENRKPCRFGAHRMDNFCVDIQATKICQKYGSMTWNHTVPDSIHFWNKRITSEMSRPNICVSFWWFQRTRKNLGRLYCSITWWGWCWWDPCYLSKMRAAYTTPSVCWQKSPLQRYLCWTPSYLHMLWDTMIKTQDISTNMQIDLCKIHQT